MIIAAVYPFIRRLLFSLDPELAHKLALQALMVCCRKSHLEPTQHDAKTCMGLHFANPLGLAAGFDKNGCYIDALGSLGFGFIEVGTVTPMPQAGNPRPRLFRLEGDQAIINRMGFNSDGMACVAQRLAKRRYRGVLGINIGKNKSTLNQEAARDYLACMKTLSSYADYFTINISSPNTPGLRELQEAGALASLLDQLKSYQKELQKIHGRYIPLVIKLSPDGCQQELSNTLKVVRSYHLDGVIISNTTLERDGVTDKQRVEEGGVSGRPLKARATSCLAQVKASSGEHMAVIASGGIMSADDALEKYQAGADLVQIYTGFVYAGPGLLSDILALSVKN